MTKPEATGQRHTPVMQQFFRAKDSHPDAIVFFRMGDFYEMFYEDAVLVSQLLDLTLTSRNKASDDAIPMAGVPHHAAAGYIARLLEKGQKVAVCEQMADPSKVKGLVPREVVRVITPGLVLDTDALDARTNNYLVAATSHGAAFGLAALELSTSELRACTLPDAATLLSELARLTPREILLDVDNEDLTAAIQRMFVRAACQQSRATEQERARAVDAVLGKERAAEYRIGLGSATLSAAGLALHYAMETQHAPKLGVTHISAYDPRAQLILDEAAIRNLELVSTLGGEKKGSLLQLLDDTRTAMGARLLRRRLLSPLTDVASIRRRHDVVESFVSAPTVRARIRGYLAEISDVERLATRAVLGVATPRDLGALRRALENAAIVRQELLAAHESVVDSPLALCAPDDLCHDVLSDLATTLVDDPPIASRDGGIIREGVDARIDELRTLSSKSRDVLLALETRERTQSGISTLKIGYTRVFGYYFEITKKNLGAVPDHFRRKQTVAGGERYTTDELETLQGKILNAEEKSCLLEAEAFAALRMRIGEHAHRLHALASKLADIDVQSCLAEIAHRFGYVRPMLDDSTRLTLIEARHPVVELLAGAGKFVPNDVSLDADAQRLMIITGPNMAGKSTLMRQTALCVILAQMGGFVPAREASIGIVDRVFTRVGASDNLSAGDSTFMLEMKETATVLREATRRSLVVLDEIGRGTSTYDGVAIAWAVAEYLHDAILCRALFATHYHELCAITETRKGASNWNVSAREHGHDVIFLHKLVEGAASRSYGVAVARLAGVPDVVVQRARALLTELESESDAPATIPKKHARSKNESQLGLFAAQPPTLAKTPENTAKVPSGLLRKLRAIDPNRMTPIEALVALSELRAELARDPIDE